MNGPKNGAESRKLSERERRGERAGEKTMEPERSEERVSWSDWPLRFRSKVMLLKIRNVLQSLFYPMPEINYKPEFEFQ